MDDIYMFGDDSKRIIIKHIMIFGIEEPLPLVTRLVTNAKTYFD